jgi:hypothetical protein
MELKVFLANCHWISVYLDFGEMFELAGEWYTDQNKWFFCNATRCGSGKEP